MKKLNSGKYFAVLAIVLSPLKCTKKFCCKLVRVLIISFFLVLEKKTILQQAQVLKSIMSYGKYIPDFPGCVED